MVSACGGRSCERWICLEHNRESARRDSKSDRTRGAGTEKSGDAADPGNIEGETSRRECRSREHQVVFRRDGSTEQGGELRYWSLGFSGITSAHKEKPY